MDGQYIWVASHDVEHGTKGTIAVIRFRAVVFQVVPYGCTLW